MSVAELAPRARTDVAEPGGVLGVVPDRLTVPLLVGVLGAALVFPVALVLTSSLLLALGAAVGFALVVLMVSDPLWAILVYIGVEVSQTGAVLAQLGVPSPFVVTQALTIVALVIAYYRGQLRAVWSPVLLGAFVLLASRAASLPNAQEPAMALSTVASETRDLATLVCAFLLLWATSGTRAAIRVCVLVLAALAGLTVVQEYLLGNSTEFLGFSQVNPPDVGSTSSRHVGPIGDPNFWGRVLLMFLPFAVALALAATTRLHRAGWWLASASLLMGIFLSQSRGAFLSAAVGLLVLLLLAGWRYARWLALTPLLGALLLLLPGIGTRLRTLGDLGEASAGGGDLSLVLRLASQEAGLRMFSSHPLLGIGAGNYEDLTPRFESGLSFATVGELGRPLAPHNAYLEYAAEGGIAGIIGLGVFLGTLFFAGLRACRTAARRAPAGSVDVDRLLAAAAVAALSGWCVASIVLHVRQFRTLLILCAIIACLDAARSRTPVRARPVALGAQGRFVVPWVALVSLVAAAGVALAATGGLYRSQWYAEATTVVTARGEERGYLDAYHYDLLTRGQVIPTFAAAIDRADSVKRLLPTAGGGVQLETGVRTRPRSADLVIVVQGDVRASVVEAARALPGASSRLVDDFRLPFELRPVAFDERQVRQVASLRPETVALVGVGLLLAAALVWGQFQAHYAAAVRQARRRPPARVDLIA